MLKTALIIFSIVCTLTLSAQVIDYAIDPSFNSELLFNKGSVSDILVNGDGDYVIMGRFNNITSPVFNSALITSNGELIDAANFAGQKVDNYKGDYLQYGHSIHRYTIPIEPLNNQFVFEYHKPEYSGFLTSNALDVLILPEDLILVAGRYFTDTSTSVESLRHLCLIDSTGSPVEGFPMVHCAQPIDAEIYTIDSLSDGSYIIAGRFSEVNGHPCNNIARLNPDFSVDTEFGNVFTSQGGAHVFLDSQDRIWVGTHNSTLIENPTEIVHFVRLMSNGHFDPSFTAPVFITYYDEGIPSEVGPTAFYEDSDGTFILAGNFLEVNGTFHKRIVKVNDNGIIIENAFSNLGADEAYWGGNWIPPLGPIAGTGITKMKKLEDGKILVGGRFSSFGGEPYSCLVRLQPSGTVGTIDAIPPSAEVKVYPNPTDQYVTIEYSLLKSMEETTIAIYDATGRLLEQRPLGNNYKGQVLLDTRKYANGLIIFEIKQDGKKVSEGKFIVVH